MQILIPYGHSSLFAALPDDLQVDILEPPEAPPAPDPLGLVRAALDSPLGEVSLSDFRSALSVAIAVNDKTRPVPHQILLPPLLERLEAEGIPPGAIQLIVATGLHEPMQPGEFSSILPREILERYAVRSHNAKDARQQVYLGRTARQTPVWMDRQFAQADLRIVVGNIEPHQFVGFSGGVKTAAIGLGGAETIQHNHAMLSDPGSRLGAYDHNPTRQDVEEIGQIAGVHFALNAILNQQKQIVHMLAGDPRALMTAGVPLSRQICQSRVAGCYDLLVVSPGGYPKDINLYQAQKALAHAALILRPGGAVILVAECSQGAGSQSYLDYMAGLTSFEQVRERFTREGFRIGPHKAFLIARDAAGIRLAFVSGMDPNQAHALLLHPAQSLQQAIDSALDGLKPDSRIGVLPHASSTIPDLGIQAGL